MKTLDEVIKAMEHCHEDNCAECPYQFEPKDFDCITQANYTDALHYLKAFRDAKDALDIERDRYAEAVKSESNDPLTWDELKGMEGKPVWVESELYPCGWEIVENTGTNIFLKDGEYLETHLSLLRREDQGETWQAYRKERE